MKIIIKRFLRILGKRITSVHAPAKPYQEGVYFLQQIIKKPDLIIDVGAADGTPELTNVFPYKTNNYLLIEANPRYQVELEKITNKYPKTTILEKSFCGSQEESLQFNINKSGYSSSKYSKQGNTEKIQVESYTLDSILKKHNLEKSSSIFLKIDVEGAEIDVLMGATETLKKCDVVIMETWINVPNSNSPSSFATLVGFMEKNGFVVFDFFAGCNHKSGVLAHLDTVFIKGNSDYRNIINL